MQKIGGVVVLFQSSGSLRWYIVPQLITSDRFSCSLEYGTLNYRKSQGTHCKLILTRASFITTGIC